MLSVKTLKSLSIKFQPPPQPTTEFKATATATAIKPVVPVENGNGFVKEYPILGGKCKYLAVRNPI